MKMKVMVSERDLMVCMLVLAGALALATWALVFVLYSKI